MTWLGEVPQPGQRCLDLGSSPGGWSWVIAGLGAAVISVDKAALAPAVASRPGVEFRRGSAFAAIPGSALRHLSHNKHELTWLWRNAGPTGPRR